MPLVLAALAGLFAERSGIVDIGLEGKMLAAAFAAAAVAAVTGSAWLGLGAGILVAIALALLHGFASITYNGNQVVSGMALNILVAGLAPMLGNAWFGQGGQTPQLTGAARFDADHLAGRRGDRRVPILGPIYADVISGHNILVYLAVVAVPLVWWMRLSHALRPAPAGGRREPARARHRRRLRRLGALPRLLI